MVQYPISLQRDLCSAADSRKHAEAADTNRGIAELERYINGQLIAQTQPVQFYDWHAIASATSLPLEFVRKHGFSIDGGSYGFTAIAHGMTYEQAMAASQTGE